MTRVSIIMPAYDAEAFIERALRSALGQSLRDIEVVVIDDASTDATAERVASLAAADRRVKLIRLPENGGNYAARNAGLAEAKGDWIALLDADDWFTPDRLERLLTAVAERPADIVADNLAFIAEGAAQPWQTLLPSKGDPVFRLTPESYLISDMRGGEKSFGLFQPMFRRHFLETHGLAYRSDVRTGGDSEFLLRCLAKTSDMLVLREPGYFYVVRPGSVSRTRSAEQLSRLKPHIDDLVTHYAHDPGMQALVREYSWRLQKYIRVKSIVDPANRAEWAKAVSALRSDLGILPAFAKYALYWIWIKLRRRVSA